MRKKGQRRKGPRKLIGNGKTARSLLNLERDIGEQNQLKEQPERGKELAKLHEDWVEEVGGR